MPKQPPEPPDHEAAWDDANYKREYSNSARCYLDLRRAAQMVVDTGSKASIRGLRAICETNQDDYRKKRNA